MRLVLAPMEGLADVNLRRRIAAHGGFDWVVSEFVRVVDRRLPDHVLTRTCPELLEGGYTQTGTPIRVQLLGNHGPAMAENAVRAIELGSHGVDINFGCPSKTVNRSRGGAILLREPGTLHHVVHSVRQALGPDVVLSAKMRLGYDDTALMLDNARAIAGGGADELTVHARTRRQSYEPPAHWDEIARIRDAIDIPVIANGDIFTVADYERCVAITGSRDAMLGRGAVRRPGLARAIRAGTEPADDWDEARRQLVVFWHEMCVSLPQKYWTGRIKGWLKHLRLVHPGAEALWHEVRDTHDPGVMAGILLGDRESRERAA